MRFQPMRPAFLRRWRLPRRYRPAREKPQIRIALFLLALCCAGAILANLNLRPIISLACRHQANLVCTQAVQEAVQEVLQQEEITYGSLVHLSRSADGGITAIETDIAAVDLLKADITSALLKKVQENTGEAMGIPLGTLLGSPYLSGRGPKVPFKVLPSRSVDLDIRGEFLSAGINQTLHQILLAVKIDADAIIPGLTTHTQVSTSFLLAETVIVGEVPDAYTQVITDQASLSGQIADYGAAPSSVS